MFTPDQYATIDRLKDSLRLANTQLVVSSIAFLASATLLMLIQQVTVGVIFLLLTVFFGLVMVRSIQDVASVRKQIAEMNEIGYSNEREFYEHLDAEADKWTEE